MSNSDTFSLHNLSDTSRQTKGRKRVGRGPGSKKGKTCGRGIKGAGARSGYKRRYGAIGGGVPLHRRVPTRGFSNARFAEKLDIVNLWQIEKLYDDGETVNIETLKEKGYITGSVLGVKVLANGELSKKVSFSGLTFSKRAKEKLEKVGLSVQDA